jgi:V-type H+-transporting ATPase subunit a
MLLLMGLFATFCGLIYNEFLGLPIGLFASVWSKTASGRVEQDGVYAFGIDTAWHHASNDLVFLNSFKMKVSVIFGITQMIGGVLLKGCNCLFFKQKTEFYFEFIPQLLFMLSIFGYLQFLIMYKWTVDWDTGASPT